METIHPDDRKNVFSEWYKLLEQEHPYRVQYRVIDVKKRWRWIASTICAVVRTTNGTVARATGFHMDITEAVRTEQVLAVAQERLRMIFEHAGIGITTSLPDGTIGQANPALGTILGRRVSDIVGKTLSDFIHPEDQEILELGLGRLVHGGRQEIQVELRFTRPDSTLIWTRLIGTISAVGLDGKRFVVAMIEDITEARRRRTKLFHDATHDSLTGAFSRGILLERLGQNINLAKRHNQPLTFCLCDLDHFKKVNDTHGHQAGDEVLTEFVHVLNESIRDTDLVGRYGGEEFGIIFPNTNTKGAQEAMERARERLKQIEFQDKEGNTFSITASFGICSVDKARSANAMIALADDALYQSKKAGRDRITIAEIQVSN